MNLTIDIGNTRTKYAVFDGDSIVVSGILENLEHYTQLLKKHPITAVITSSVGQNTDFQLQTPKNIHFHSLTPSLPLPVSIDYQPPTTLGADRIAACVGAAAIFPSRNCLVIDAGTCITIDFIDSKGTYRGGAIMPGLSMKFEALHTFTEKLPLLHLSDICGLPDKNGKSTEQSILSGVANGTAFEINGFVNAYKSTFDDLRILITGGDAAKVSEFTVHSHSHIKDLTLIGLNKILEYNEKQNI